jgi:hypothetical protein
MKICTKTKSIKTIIPTKSNNNYLKMLQSVKKLNLPKALTTTPPVKTTAHLGKRRTRGKFQVAIMMLMMKERMWVSNLNNNRSLLSNQAVKHPKVYSLRINRI